MTRRVPGRPLDSVLTARLQAAARELLTSGGVRALQAKALSESVQAGKAAIYRRWSTMLDVQLDMVDSLVLFETLPNWAGADVESELREAWSRPVTQDELVAGLLLTSSEGEPLVREAVAGLLDVQVQSWRGALGFGPGVSPVLRLGRALIVHRWLGGRVDARCASVFATLVLALPRVSPEAGHAAQGVG